MGSIKCEAPHYAGDSSALAPPRPLPYGLRPCPAGFACGASPLRGRWLRLCPAGFAGGASPLRGRWLRPCAAPPRPLPAGFARYFRYRHMARGRPVKRKGKRNFAFPFFRSRAFQPSFANSLSLHICRPLPPTQDYPPTPADFAWVPAHFQNQKGPILYQGGWGFNLRTVIEKSFLFAVTSAQMINRCGLRPQTN